MNQSARDQSAMNQYAKDQYKEVRRVLILILFLNLSVSLAKVLYGWMSRSVSMTADGFHSLSDGASNIIALVGIWFASRPADSGHPYGHKKFETFTTLGIAASLMVLAYGLGVSSIDRFRHPSTPEVDFGSFAVMLVTLSINIWVTGYETARGKALGSDLLISDALHTKSDIYVSISVIASLIGVKLGWTLLDPIAGAIIAVLILKAAVNILRHSVNVLCDSSVIEESRIESAVLEVEGVRKCHRIRTRGRQDAVHVDLHVLVDGGMTVDQAHGLAHRISDKLKGEIQGVCDVITHIEPEEDGSWLHRASARQPDRNRGPA